MPDMTTYRVLDNIPIPTSTKKGPRGSLWEFEKLAVNQCIEVDVGGGVSDALRAAAGYYKATHKGWDFTSKRMIVDGRSVVRLWRIA